MKLCYFCPKCKCKICIFHSIDDNGNESCYWGYIEEIRKSFENQTIKSV